MNSPELTAAMLPSSLNLILLVLVIAASLAAILQTTRDRVTNSARWIPVSSALILFALAATWSIPTVAGYVSGLLWLLFALVPSIGFRVSDYYFHHGSYKWAYRVKRAMNWLHPLADWPWQAALFQAHIALQGHDRALAAAILQKGLGAHPEPERVALCFVIQRDWPALLQWWESYPQPEKLTASPKLLRYYLLALGESGQLNQLVTTFFARQATLNQVPLLLNFAQLYLFAFGGRVEETTTLLNLRFSNQINPAMSLYWIATAHYASHHADLGHALLKPLAQATDNGVILLAVEARLRTGVAATKSALSPALAHQLDQHATQWQARTQMLDQWH